MATFERTVVDATTDPKWDELVSRVPSSVFHSPGWLRVLRDTYDFEVQAAILVGADGRPAAGLPYVTVEDMMDRRIVSLPFSDFCDPLVSSPDEWSQLISPLLSDRPARIRFRCLFSDVPTTDDRFTTVSRAKWHGIDLTVGDEVLWSQIHSSARRAIRKARSQGVTVRRAGSIEDMRTFFELHRKVRKYKYRLLPQPYAFFEAIWEHLLAPGHGTLMLADHDGVVIGAILYLEWGDTLYYKFNASDIDQLAVRPNDLLIWEGILYALSRGLSSFDFGLSDWDQDGLLRYKRKYASDERTIAFLDHVPPDMPSRRDREARAMLPNITDLLVGEDVPDAVTERAADVLYRYFT